MPHLQHARDDSRSNENEALSVLSTWESAAMVSFSTGTHGAKLGVLDEGDHDGVLLAGQDCNTRFIKEHKPSNHIRARIKSHVYTTE